MTTPEHPANCPACAAPGLLYTCVHCGASTFDDFIERHQALEKLLYDLTHCGLVAEKLPRHVIDRAHALYGEQHGRPGALVPPAVLSVPKSWCLHRMPGDHEAVLISTPDGHGLRLTPGDAALGPTGRVLLELAVALINGGARCTR